MTKDERHTRPGPHLRPYGECPPTNLVDRVLGRETRLLLLRNCPEALHGLDERLASYGEEQRSEGMAEALTAPPPAVPTQLVTALRNGDATCDVTIVGIPVTVALRPSPPRIPDQPRELAIWQAIRHAHRDTATHIPTGTGIARHYQPHPNLPDEVTALLWKQDGATVYVTGPACRPQTLRTLRRRASPHRPPPLIAGLTPLIVDFGQRAAQVVAQLATAPTAAAVSTTCALAVVTATPPFTEVDAWAAPRTEQQAHVAVEPDLPAAYPTPPSPSPTPSAEPTATLTHDETVPASTPRPTPTATAEPASEASPVPPPSPTVAPEPASSPEVTVPSPTVEPSPTAVAPVEPTPEPTASNVSPGKSAKRPQFWVGKPSEKPRPGLQRHHHRERDHREADNPW